jgi:ABC-2 type transport system ATP-binding protein
MKALRVVDVSRRYAGKSGGNAVQALQHVSLTLHRGEILAVLGLNGAGKTTLVKILAGLIRPDAGSILIDDLSSSRSATYLGRIGAVFEGNRNIYWRMTAFENLQYFAVLRGLSFRQARQRADLLLDLFGLEARRKSVAAHLSRGTQQRLAVAIALVHEPEVVILDEPTLGVDVENVLQIVATLKLLAREGMAIVLTTHHFDVVRMLADRIVLLVGGRVAAIEAAAAFLDLPGQHSYTLALMDPLDAERQERLGALGVTTGDSQLQFGAASLYDVIDAVRPLRVGSLKVCEEDFARGFLDRVKSYREDPANAEPVPD